MPLGFYMMIQSDEICPNFHAPGRTVFVQTWTGTSISSHSLWQKGKCAVLSRAKLAALLLNLFPKDSNLWFKEMFVRPGNWSDIKCSLINIFFDSLLSYKTYLWNHFLRLPYMCLWERSGQNTSQETRPLSFMLQDSGVCNFCGYMGSVWSFSLSVCLVHSMFWACASSCVERRYHEWPDAHIMT